MTTALITGATQGLGAETAARLAHLGWTVWLGARDTQAGERVAASIDGDVRVVQLDVTSDESVAAARDAVGSIDVLVNNASVSAGRSRPEEEPLERLVEVYAVNVLGVVRVTQAFLPLLRQAEHPRLVMVSSTIGSFATMSSRDPAAATAWGAAYPSSKAALNMITLMYDRSLDGIRVTPVAPGFTSTALNGFSGTQTVAEGAEAIVSACAAEDLEPGLLSRDGVVPW